MFTRFAQGFGESVDNLPEIPCPYQQKNKVPINTLEFFGIIFFVLFFAEKLKGKRLHVETDSQSALSWCLAARVKGN